MTTTRQSRPATTDGNGAHREKRSLVQLATPIFMGSLLANLTILFNTILIGRAEQTGLLLAGLFLPFSFLVTALIESMRAPAVVVATQSPRREEIPVGVATFALLGAVVLLAVGGLVRLFGEVLFAQLQVPPEVLQRALEFILYMLAASSLLVAGAIVNAAVFAIARGRAAMLVSIAANVINLAVTALCAYELKQGALGAAWGTASAGLFMIALSFRLLAGAVPKAKVHLMPVVCRALALAATIALPVLGSYLLLCLYLALINQILLPLGATTVGGFGIASRLQNLIMLPAAALGTALAIRAGQMHGALDSEKVAALVRQGIVLALGVYFFIALAVCIAHAPLARLLTGDAAIGEIVRAYLLAIGPSYVLFGPLLAVLIYLDQVGQGRLALLFNALTLGATVAAAYFAARHFRDFNHVFLAIAAGNLAAAILMFFIVRRPEVHRSHRRIAQGGVS